MSNLTEMKKLAGITPRFPGMTEAVPHGLAHAADRSGEMTRDQAAIMSALVAARSAAETATTKLREAQTALRNNLKGRLGDLLTKADRDKANELMSNLLTDAADMLRQVADAAREIERGESFKGTDF